jgi:hypothetical protein
VSADNAAERRRALGIPVHGDDEHEWRTDGYCNCGVEKPTRRSRAAGPIPPEGRKAGISNLDVIEQNWSEYR